MKKYALAIVLGLCLVLTLFSGCGKKGDGSPSGSDTSSPGSSPSSDVTSGENNGGSTAADPDQSGSGQPDSSDSETGAPGNNSADGDQQTAGGNGGTNDPDDPDLPDNSPTIYLEAEGQNDKVILKVCVRNNPGVASFSFKVNYDKNAVSPEKIEKGLISVTSNLQSTTNLSGYVTAVYVNANGTNENGTLFSVTFSPKDGADSAAFSISADKNAFVNAEFKPVDFKLKGTEIEF